jgi:hypothetical protein
VKKREVRMEKRSVDRRKDREGRVRAKQVRRREAEYRILVGEQ